MTATTAQKNIWIAYILAFILGGAGLLYLGREEDKTMGIILTIVAIIGWFTFIIWFIAMIVGIYFTYKTAKEMGL
jgi:TM2 domain-containing membrane protein YozV